MRQGHGIWLSLLLLEDFREGKGVKERGLV